MHLLNGANVTSRGAQCIESLATLTVDALWYITRCLALMNNFVIGPYTVIYCRLTYWLMVKLCHADGQKCVDLVMLTFDILSYKLIRQLHVTLNNFPRNFEFCRASHFRVRCRQGTGRRGAIHNAAFWWKGRRTKARMRLKQEEI